jgi:hypothetical protein
VVGFKADVLTSVFVGESGLKKQRVLCALGENVCADAGEKGTLYIFSLFFTLFLSGVFVCARCRPK